MIVTRCKGLSHPIFYWVALMKKLNKFAPWLKYEFKYELKGSLTYLIDVKYLCDENKQIKKHNL